MQQATGIAALQQHGTGAVGSAAAAVVVVLADADVGQEQRLHACCGQHARERQQDWGGFEVDCPIQCGGGCGFQALGAVRLNGGVC